MSKGPCCCPSREMYQSWLTSSSSRGQSNLDGLALQIDRLTIAVFTACSPASELFREKSTEWRGVLMSPTY
jgi:hypothetical protein